ncbi:MAG: SDR family NAD(P)-dependent oxidoreductase [Nocardioidaceae bacterium]
MRTNVLITGASSGLGAGMARIFAGNGHSLALAARRTDRLEELRAELEAANPAIDVRTYPLDVTDHGQVFEVFAAAARDLGGLDRTNVVAAALAQCEAAMEHFYERSTGHLGVISSVSAMRGMPGSMATYAATKAAVAHLAEGIRSDLLGRRGHDIAVATVYPGYIASEMNADVEQKLRLMVETETGCRAIVEAIDSEVAGRGAGVAMAAGQRRAAARATVRRAQARLSPHGPRYREGAARSGRAL